jgi:Flp pilus assembly pilin Flp
VRISVPRGSLQDRRGLVSLEYAVLAAAVVTAIFAATGALQQQMRTPFDRMEAASTASTTTVRFNHF